MSPDYGYCYDPYGRLKGTGHDKLIHDLQERADRLTVENAALRTEIAELKKSNPRSG